MSKFLILNMGFVRFLFEVVLQWENDLVIVGCCMLFSPNNHNRKMKSQRRKFYPTPRVQTHFSRAVLQSVIIKTWAE